VFKRTWIILMITLALAAILSACGGGDLAEELTPIPTLPPGSEPELVSALQAGAVTQATTGEPTAEAGGEMSQEELAALGEPLFASACSACHGEQDGAGPAFTGMGERAATRVEGMSAEAYLHESIVDPGAYVVEGFSNIMPKGFGDRYSETELAGLVSYIMAESGGEAAVQAGPTEEATPDSTEEAVPTPESTDEATEAPAGDPAAGEELFATNCSACHGEEDGAGPARTGMGERAATRVAGLSAEEYLHQSIVDPGAYVVEGFGNIMPKAYGDQLSEKELNDLITYLLTQ
jgi:mono/diheme cytochrome c family protein